MKPGTLYIEAGRDARRFVLTRLVAKTSERVDADGEPSDTPFDLWDVTDVETGAVRQLDEEEIFICRESPAQVGQTWMPDDLPSIILVGCYRYAGVWCWFGKTTDGAECKISEEALLSAFARVDGLDAPVTRAAPPRAA